MERARSRSKSFYEEDEEEEQTEYSGTPMPDSSFLSGMGFDKNATPLYSDDSNDGDGDDVDPALDAKLEELANTPMEEDMRRRSRSFFDQTDVASGLKSALPPQVGGGGGATRHDSMTGEPVKQQVRTGKLKMNELHALKQGLQDAHINTVGGGSKAYRRDSDFHMNISISTPFNLLLL